MCLFLGLIPLRKFNLFQIFKLKRFYFLIIFIVLWFVKNIIISGCIIYPVKSSCFKSLIWSDLKLVEHVSIENEAYTKAWPDYNKIISENNNKIIAHKICNERLHFHSKKVTLTIFIMLTLS